MDTLLDIFYIVLNIYQLSFSDIVHVTCICCPDPSVWFRVFEDVVHSPKLHQCDRDAKIVPKHISQ